MTSPTITPATGADLEVMRGHVGRPMRGVIGVAARCVCGNPVVVVTEPRLPDGTPFPTHYYLTHPGATSALSSLEADHVMRDLSDELAADEDIQQRYRAAHEAYIADRDRYGEVPEIAGVSAGGMPSRVKCLHALAAHSLAVGPGVNPIGDRALELADWSITRCECAESRWLGVRTVPWVGTLAVALIVLIGGTAASAVPTETSTPSPSPTTTEDPDEDPTRAAEYWLEDYGIEEAWETTRGEGVTIAIIDTGIASGPPELDGAVSGGKDFSGVGAADGRTPVGAVDSSHGTWVASLAAARGLPDDEGMIGVAPEATLLSASIGFGTSSAVPFVDQVADAIRWAVDEGADVINLSFTTNTLDWDESWDDAFLYAFDHDVVVVVAAGNRGRGTDVVGAPATIPGVLTVAGVTKDGEASVEASTQGVTIGIAAPSEELLGISPDGDVVEWSGTSGAAPIVAGIAALVRAAHPELDAANVINRIIQTATAPPGDGDLPSTLYGYGLIDAEAAVTDDVDTVTENPMGSLSEWIRVFRRGEAPEQPTETVTPVTLPDLPPADTVTEAGSALVPSQESLRYGTVPLFGLTTGAILVALGVTAAARRIQSARRTRSPSK